ncbi:DotU family type IV/VI secretion system protein [Francisella sp. SYW-9]|uniref:DotU family type IV/VI secretion system protein n=1 Tax=Francisella sp. SYW-9 TaxID=2610888 RepID=UPI00123D47F3|nr:DotU family type IV/VI secretion system protein [Francisella sp. SYW-9]
MHQSIIDVFVTINTFVEEYNVDIQVQDLIAFRNKIIHKTNDIRDMIYQDYGERVSFFIAFAIYSYCDEMINKVSLNMQNNLTEWHLLQEEVYQRNDGGDYFFEIVDNVLDNPVFPKVVSQVLYLILALGFKGCYLGVESEIDKYKNKLNTILPKHDIKGLDYSVYNDKNVEFKRTNKSRLLKALFMIGVSFPILTYLSIWLVR